MKGFPGGSDGNKSACNAGGSGSTPGLGKSPGLGDVNPLHYSCLENSTNREGMRLQKVRRDWETNVFQESNAKFYLHQPVDYNLGNCLSESSEDCSACHRSKHSYKHFWDKGIYIKRHVDGLHNLGLLIQSKSGSSWSLTTLRKTVISWGVIKCWPGHPDGWQN